MLSLFRRFAGSPLGIGLFGIITLAFIVTLYEGRSGLGGAIGGLNGDAVVSVGGSAIDANEIRKRAQNQIEAARQRNPAIDVASFVNGGGLDQTIDGTADAYALEVFAKQQGMVASRRAVDGEIAGNPAFAGATGAFDPVRFQALLSERRIPEADLRRDIGRSILARSLLVPIAGSAHVPAALVEPYSALLLERRTGHVLFVPAALFAPRTTPAEAEVASYYRTNMARYRLPEQRVIRYTAFDKARFAGASAATDAEIAQAYTAASAQYAARERRAFTQVIVSQRDQADAVAAKVRGGTPIAEAARSVQREAIAVPPTDQAAFAKITSSEVAQAAFAAAKGALATVTKSPFGYHIVRVDRVDRIAATPLSVVRAKLAAGIEAQKQQRAMGEFAGQIEDAISSRSSIDALASKFGLTLLTSPPATRDGRVIGGNTALAPEVTATLKDAFVAEAGDEPGLVQGPGGSMILWKLDRKIAAVAMPLAKIHDQVVRDTQLAQGARAAKAAADKVTAAINAGKPLAQAMATSPVALPAPQAAGGRRADLQQAPPQVRAPLSLMFAIPEHHARVLEVPGGSGWMIVHLDQIVRADPRSQPGLIQATQQQLSSVIGAEYFEQFSAAVRNQVGVKKNTAAIAALRRSMLGGGAAQ